MAVSVPVGHLLSRTGPLQLTLEGSAPYLHLIGRRLRRLGWDVRHTAGTAPCAVLDGRRLALGQSGVPFGCQAEAAVAARWLEPGEAMGFLLLAEGTPSSLTGWQPLLDALAPARGMWLCCGPAGSALFVGRVLELFSYACGPAVFPQGATPDSLQAVLADPWRLLQTQQGLLPPLAACARAYLARYPLPPSSANPVSPPPAPGHAHFAQALAAFLLTLLEPLTGAPTHEASANPGTQVW